MTNNQNLLTETFHPPPGFFKCENEKYFLKLTQVCNGIIDCKYGTDELFCKEKLICPKKCICNPIYIINCSKESLLEQPLKTTGQKMLIISDLNKTIEAFQSLSITYFEIEKTNFQKFKILNLLPNLYYLKITKCNLINLNEIYLNNDNDNNENEFVFMIQYLNLMDNPIEINYEYSFKNFHNLYELNLSKTKIKYLTKNLFKNLNKLKILKINYCKLSKIYKNSLIPLKLLNIFQLKSTKILQSINIFSNEIIENLKNLKYFLSDYYEICCMLKKFHQNYSKCIPNKSLIKSCNDVLSSLILKIFTWFFGVFSCIFNFLSLLINAFNNRNGKKLFYICLAVGDLFTGFFFLAIAFVDLHYSGVYFEYDSIWRNSLLCKIIGCLASFSFIYSLISLLFITLERYHFIKYPFRIFLNFFPKLFVCLGMFCLSFFLALLPVLIVNVNYFKLRRV